MKVYAVMGEQGEYSDRSVWLAKVFCDENKAKEYIIEATSIAKELYKKYEDDEERFFLEKGFNQFDLNHQSLSYETKYYYEESELTE